MSENEQSKNVQAGHAAHAYPLWELTRPLPSLAGLQAFVTVARLGSLSKAAGHLSRTQGALSRQIQQLEAHYRCALFVRRASGLTLTAEGETLLDVSLRVLTQLRAHADAQRDAASILTLRLPSTFAVRWLLPRLAALTEAMHDIELRIATSSDDVPDFAQTDLDAMVVRGKGPWNGMESVTLFAETLTPMCAPAMASAIGAVSDLARTALLHAGPGRAEWRCWLEQMGGEDVDVSKGLVFDTLELALSAAQEGHGVAIGDPRLARERLRSGALIAPFRETVRNGASYFLIYPAQRANQSKIRTLADALLALARDDADYSPIARAAPSSS